MIRPVVLKDVEAIARIYNYYVLNTVVTFDEHPVSHDDIVTRMEAVQGASLPWLMLEHSGQAVGYAYAGKWHVRSAFRYTCECAVYLDPHFIRQGYGSKLYGALFPLLREKNMHAVMAAITLPNEPSVALHEKFGFTKVGHHKEVGFKFHRWIDVGYWQLKF